MASVKFIYRSKKSKAPLILKLRFNRNKKSCTVDAPINLIVERKYWDEIHFSKSKDVLVTNKQFKVNKELLLIEQHISTAVSKKNVYNFDKSWLVNQIDLYYNPEQFIDQSISCCIQKIIDEAPFRDNAKGGIGLSKSRVDSYKQLLLHFNNFQGKKNYDVVDVNKKVFDGFKMYLLGEKKFAATYAVKKLADLKTVCKDAEARGIPTSIELKGVKTKQVSPYDDDMDVIPLTLEDVEKIENADLKKAALINARKWLILGVFTGQRGETLTKRIVKKNFYKYGSGLEIRVTQKKGNKNVRIPVLPRVKKIYDEGLPYSISTQKLRKHFKEIGRLAELNEMIMGRITEAVGEGKNKERRGVKKLRPKYKYIGLHTLRRSFACIHEGEMPREVIMKVTGHRKLETYLQYVNQDRNEHLDVFLDYYKLLEQKAQKKSQLSVVGKKPATKKAN